VLPRVAKEIDQPNFTKPTQVVEQQGAALSGEVNEGRKLCANSGPIVVKGCPIQEVSFCRSPRRVPNHSCPSAHEGDGATTV
jgi:hypothetical protein